MQHARKTFALGFLMNITSLSMLFDDLTSLPKHPLKYLLTFKYSQDNLEIFISLIRLRSRTQDNPNPLEFRYKLRKLLFRNSVQPSVNANCVDDSFNSNHVIEYRNYTLSFTWSLIENRSSEGDDDFINNMVRHLESSPQSPYQQNVLYYIAGLIVNIILRINTCHFCHDILTTVHDNCLIFSQFILY